MRPFLLFVGVESIVAKPFERKRCDAVLRGWNIESQPLNRKSQIIPVANAGDAKQCFEDGILRDLSRGNSCARIEHLSAHLME
jgi:hypothetical protein